MKSKTERIIDIFYNITKCLVIFGVLALFSLFFTPTFPLCRLLIAIIPICLGAILGIIAKVIAHIVYTTQAVMDSLQKRNDKDNKSEE